MPIDPNACAEAVTIAARATEGNHPTVCVCIEVKKKLWWRWVEMVNHITPLIGV